MLETVGDKWRSSFLQTVQQPENSGPLKEAALREKMTDWTQALTDVAVTTCRFLGWQASAKGHLLEFLPISRNEYLSLDIVAFPTGNKQWQFPVAAIELENRKDIWIAYSLWKVLCVRTDVRVVFCYRKHPDQSAALIRYLCQEVIQTMDVTDRMNMEGQTLVVVGNRGESETFPYGFFKWWELDKNTGTFRQI